MHEHHSAWASEQVRDLRCPVPQQAIKDTVGITATKPSSTRHGKSVQRQFAAALYPLLGNPLSKVQDSSECALDRPCSILGSSFTTYSPPVDRLETVISDRETGGRDSSPNGKRRISTCNCMKEAKSRCEVEYSYQFEGS